MPAVEMLLSEGQRHITPLIGSENVVHFDPRTAGLDAARQGKLDRKRSLPRSASPGVNLLETASPRLGLVSQVIPDAKPIYQTYEYKVMDETMPDEVVGSDTPIISEEVWASVYDRRELEQQPLLSRDEEIALGTLMEQGTAARATLNEKSFKSDAERVILDHVAQEGLEARRIFIEANIGLAKDAALRKFGMAELADLRQAGCLGLIMATDGFNWRVGRFSTYATPIIRQEISNIIRLSSPRFTLKPDMWRAIYRYRGVERILRQQLGREPSIEEVGSALGLTTQEITNRKPILESVFVSLSEPIRTDEGEISLQDTVADTSFRAVDDEVINNQIPGEIASDFIDGLTSLQRQALPLVFEDKQHGLLKTLAEQNGVSHEAMRKRKENVVAKLIKYLQEKGWWDEPQVAFA